MRPYEVMVIFDPALDEAVMRATTERFATLVRSAGGQPGPVQTWGRRRLAYEVARRSEGYYELWPVRADPAVMAEVDRQLFLADEVLRHKVIRLPERMAGAGAPAADVAAPGAAPTDGDANGV